MPLSAETVRTSIHSVHHRGFENDASLDGKGGGLKFEALRVIKIHVAGLLQP
jgi:hypothetical protein